MIPLARETVTLYNRRLVAGADGRKREVWRQARAARLQLGARP